MGLFHAEHVVGRSFIRSFIYSSNTQHLFYAGLDAEDSALKEIDPVSILELFLLRGGDDVKQIASQQSNQNNSGERCESMVFRVSRTRGRAWSEESGKAPLRK